MSFTWPWALLALLLIPALLLVAAWLRRRRRRAAVRVSSIALVRAALPGRSSWVRRIPVALLLAGLLVLGVGVARPQASVAVPSNATTILLTLDVSSSMCSTDVQPNRLTVAQRAAESFVKSRPAGSRIGLIAFSGVAGVLVSPTDDKDALLGAIDDLTTSRGTAIGQAILTAIDAISEVDPNVSPTGVTDAPTNAPTPEIGSAADAVVLLTDGANTQGVDPATAAEQAAARGVPVYTIGFGTTNPAPFVCDPDQIGSGGGFGGFGGGFGNGGRAGQEIDEHALTQVAQTTGGKYYRAANADQLQGALERLPSAISVSHQDVDLAAWFAGAGGLLIAAAVALSLWFRRPRRPRAGRS